MHVERIERQTLADRQVVASLLAAGAQVELPTVHEAIAAFDAALIAEPERAAVVDIEQWQLRRALGVA